jgi:hypothetical protein
LRGAGWYERGIFESSNALVLVRSIHRRDAGCADKDKEKKPQRRKGRKVVSVIKKHVSSAAGGNPYENKKIVFMVPACAGMIMAFYLKCLSLRPLRICDATWICNKMPA